MGGETPLFIFKGQGKAAWGRYQLVGLGQEGGEEDVSQEEHCLWSHRGRKKSEDLRKAWLECGGRVGLGLR